LNSDFKTNLLLKKNKLTCSACLYLTDEEYEDAISTFDEDLFSAYWLRSKCNVDLSDDEELSSTDSSSIESYLLDEADADENEDDGTESVISAPEEWPPLDGEIPFELVPTTKRRIQNCFHNDDVNV